MTNPPSTPEPGRGYRVAARTLLTAATGAALVAAASATASAAPTATPSTTANVQVDSVMTLSGLPTSFSLRGAPSDTVTTTAPVTMNVLTNNPLGYNVTVQAAADALTGSVGNSETIPIDALSVRESGNGSYTPLSSTGAVSVHLQNTRSALTGDTIRNDFQVAIPNVVADTYSVTLNYTAAPPV